MQIQTNMYIASQPPKLELQGSAAYWFEVGGAVQYVSSGGHAPWLLGDGTANHKAIMGITQINNNNIYNVHRPP